MKDQPDTGQQDTGRPFVVIMTTGKEDGGHRATLGVSMALASMAQGIETTIYMTGLGSVWAYSGGADGIHLQGFEPLELLLDEFIKMGGKMVVCATCLHGCACSDASAAEGCSGSLRHGTLTAGLAYAVKTVRTGQGCVTF
ncbi:MAG: DsrE family protein [Deltaproteobacteria bacterium]|nr:DsrE family protein [Deltaproteobacteria bacterium]